MHKTEAIPMKKIRLLIDFGSIKTGGGAQLATNFLNFMREYPDDVEKVFLLIPELGPLSQHIDASRYDGILVYPNSYWKRKLFELTTLRKFVMSNRVNIFYTFFGAGIPAPSGVRSIVSVAYPIICYPESNYWKFLPLKTKLITKSLNELRCRRIRLADGVIAETKIMAERLSRYAGIQPDCIHVLPPSPSAFLKDGFYRPKSDESAVRFLILGGLDRHKNVWRLLELAEALETKGFTNFIFLISATRAAFNAAYPECRPSDALVERHFEFLGVIPSQQIQQVYDRADFLMNLSDLESFSNNYMEAWKSGLPLICSDTDFARHICSDSAVYIDPHEPSAAAAVIIKISQDQVLQKNLTEAGKKYLAALPTLDEKFAQTMLILRDAI
jgi:glycosyltransferase involved in cell wall biosynthesis